MNTSQAGTEKSVRVYAKKDRITIKQEQGFDRWLLEEDVICIRRRKEFLFFVWDKEEEGTLRLMMAVPVPKKQHKQPKRYYSKAGY